MFFFHMPRSSIQPMPNSCEATSQTCPKSWEISSLITETRKGELESRGAPKPPVALAAVIATIPARHSRRVNGEGMTDSFFIAEEGWPQIYHHRTAGW